MVRALLGLTVTPEADAADALAIGLTHLRAQESVRDWEFHRPSDMNVELDHSRRDVLSHVLDSPRRVPPS